MESKQRGSTKHVSKNVETTRHGEKDGNDEDRQQSQQQQAYSRKFLTLIGTGDQVGIAALISLIAVSIGYCLQKKAATPSDSAKWN